MPQQNALYPDLTLWHNLGFTASIFGMPWSGRRRRLKEALDFVELTDAKERLFRDASGGMKRRLALAATLIHDPDLMFLDEPTAGIDPVLRKKIWDRFAELRNKGRTLFVTTQYVAKRPIATWLGSWPVGACFWSQLRTTCAAMHSAARSWTSLLPLPQPRNRSIESLGQQVPRRSNA